MRDALCTSSPTLQDHSANELLKKALKILHDQQQLQDEAVQMKVDAVIGELLDQQQLR